MATSWVPTAGAPLGPEGSHDVPPLSPLPCVCRWMRLNRFSLNFIIVTCVCMHLCTGVHVGWRGVRVRAFGAGVRGVACSVGTKSQTLVLVFLNTEPPLQPPIVYILSCYCQCVTMGVHTLWYVWRSEDSRPFLPSPH